MIDLSHTPSPELLKAVRAALLLRGQSLTGWARANGVKRQNLCKALTGQWTGPGARTLVKQVRSDLKEDQ